MLDERLADLIEQYKKFKKNVELDFELSSSPELTGNYCQALVSNPLVSNLPKPTND